MSSRRSCAVARPVRTSAANASASMRGDPGCVSPSHSRVFSVRCRLRLSGGAGVARLSR
jgi:hypothetical protein